MNLTGNREDYIGKVRGRSEKIIYLSWLKIWGGKIEIFPLLRQWRKGYQTAFAMVSKGL